ncbi:MAG: hypothetical protein ACP5TO_07225, partial [Thermoplasmata archaeon]
AYDPANGYMYVTNSNSGTVSLINGMNEIGNVSLGTYPDGIAYDPANGYMYVTNSNSGTVSVINDMNEIGNVTVGYRPNAIAYDPANGYMYVTNSNSGTVSLINGMKDLKNIYVGIFPEGLAFYPVNEYVYVVNYDSGTISIIGTAYNITFYETGLVSGTLWYVNLSNRESFTSTNNTISFKEPVGNYSYTIGTVNTIFTSYPSFGMFTVNNRSLTEKIKFSTTKVSTYTITFIENGLNYGETWSVMVNKIQEKSNTSSIQFTLLNGTYIFNVTKITQYAISPMIGIINISGSNVIKNIYFKLKIYNITFTESGMPLGKNWGVYLKSNTEQTFYNTSNSFNVSFNLELYNYTYLIPNNSNYTFSPENGSLTLGNQTHLNVFVNATPTSKWANPGFNYSTNQGAIAVGVSPNGKYIGISNTNGGGWYFNQFFSLYNSNGQLLWTNTSLYDIISVNFAGDNQYVALGSLSLASWGIYNAMIYVFNLNGTLVWNYSFVDYSMYSGISTILISNNGTNVSVIGPTTAGSGAAIYMFYMGKLVYYYNISFNFQRISMSPNGEYVLCGGTLNKSIILDSFNFKNGFVWQKVIGTDYSKYINQNGGIDALQISNEGYIAFGAYEYNANSTEYYYLGVMGSNGNVKWVVNNTALVSSINISNNSTLFNFVTNSWKLTPIRNITSYNAYGEIKKSFIIQFPSNQDYFYFFSWLSNGNYLFSNSNNAYLYSSEGILISNFTYNNSAAKIFPSPYTPPLINVISSENGTSLVLVYSDPIFGSYASDGVVQYLSTSVTYNNTSISFIESGLPENTSWGVSIFSGSKFYSLNESIYLHLPQKAYVVSVINPRGYISQNQFIYLNLSNISHLVIYITFIKIYQVTFNEYGLVNGTFWSIDIGSTTFYSKNNTITFTESNGTYSYSIESSNNKYAPLDSSGIFTVNGKNVSINVIFKLVTYSISFTETGLPYGILWYLNLSNGQSFKGSEKVITFNETNGTYSYVIGISNDTYLASPSSGTFNVTGFPVSVSISFSSIKTMIYTIKFFENGLVAGTTWAITLNNVTINSMANIIEFNESNGSYTYTIGSINGYTASPSYGTITVNGANVSQTITFTATTTTTYTITFTETGLPSGTSWSVTLNGVTKTSTTNTITFTEPYGSYTYTITLPSGYKTITSTGSVSTTQPSLNVPVTVSSTSPTPAPTPSTSASNNDLLIVVIVIVIIIAVLGAVMVMRKDKNKKSPKEWKEPPKN